MEDLIKETPLSLSSSLSALSPPQHKRWPDARNQLSATRDANMIAARQRIRNPEEEESRGSGEEENGRR